MAIVSITYIGFIFYLSFAITSLKYDERNRGVIFIRHLDMYLDIIGYSFLSIFVLMLIATILLVHQVKYLERQEQNLLENLQFKAEKRTLIVTLLIFTLNYAFLFIWGEASPNIIYNNFFAGIVIAEVIAIFDGFTFFCLLIVHNRNFERQSKVEFAGNMLEVSTSSEPVYLHRVTEDDCDEIFD